MDTMQSTDAQADLPAKDDERSKGTSIWRRVLSLRRSEHPKQNQDGGLERGVEPAEGARFVGFDEQRYYGDEGRADIVFGPDMFDPRTENGARPLSRAVAEGHSEIDPADFEKTVGEVLGEDVDLKQLTQVSLRNAESIEVPPAE